MVEDGDRVAQGEAHGGLLSSGARRLLTVARLTERRWAAVPGIPAVERAVRAATCPVGRHPRPT
jgi:hypothetical protein